MALLTDSTRIAAGCLRKGGLIAYPTESVFGLGCIPENQQAVSRLRTIKQRPAEQGLILITDRLERVQSFLKPLSARQKSLIHARRHKPVTWLVPASTDCPAWLLGRHDCLAIRITQHEGARKLCRQAESALVSTSANRRGQVPAKTATEALHTLGNELDCILSASTGLARTVSEIRDLKTGKVYR